MFFVFFFSFLFFVFIRKGFIFVLAERNYRHCSLRSSVAKLDAQRQSHDLTALSGDDRLRYVAYIRLLRQTEVEIWTLFCNVCVFARMHFSTVKIHRRSQENLSTAPLQTTAAQSSPTRPSVLSIASTSPLTSTAVTWGRSSGVSRAYLKVRASIFCLVFFFFLTQLAFRLKGFTPLLSDPVLFLSDISTGDFGERDVTHRQCWVFDRCLEAPKLWFPSKTQWNHRGKRKADIANWDHCTVSQCSKKLCM